MAKHKNHSDPDQVKAIDQVEPDVEANDDSDLFEKETEPSTDAAEFDEADPELDIPEPRLDARKAERVDVRVQTVVHFKESEEDAWKEMIEVTTVSKNGAALMLSRPCPVGRIVSLVMQMPKNLRAYDLHAPVYPMLAIVQNCSATVVNDQSLYHVGVAFIGKKVPQAYKSNPRQCFRIKGVNKDGLWEPVASAKQFMSRKHSRFWRRLEVTVTVRDQVRKMSHKMNVLTRDVSAGGMAIWGPLDVRVGDRVKITSKEPEFYSMAVVRNKTENSVDERKTLVHFEFDGGRFPVERLPMPEKEKTAETETAEEQFGDVEVSE